MSEVDASERQQIVEIIALAWDDARYPGDDRIINSLPRDDAGKLQQGFIGKHWRDISLETLIVNRDHIPFFTIEAFVFYLPAFMSAVVLHYEIVDVLSNNTILNLSPTMYPDEMSFFEELVNKFNNPQKSAIRLFVETCAKLDYDHFEFSPSRLQAVRYWQQNG